MSNHHPRALNFLTPEEALTKRCPFAQLAANCAATDCMAWRWASTLTVNNPSRAPGAAEQSIKHEAGYCGMAGRP